MPARKASGQAKRRADEPPGEHLIDEALEDTFPASDPPFFVGGGAEPAPTKPEAPDEKDGKRPVHHEKR
jgi:hypothetical protein